ncbi:type IX secretion system sortase PorU [Pontibacter sp. JH31]|uniref:Type IX secretion system sortase PorU n=1 Tax=Pontibacter aquaedesilientis TaxID=2766980 RepID=A0ABR7XFZ1_9BACT|nr:type IX secretion system sortase PorU [Pontibacter aquaedesilientis]MBD1396523.1 type IX secretion system sortase PorU [Pontibacter aquaedesilientis]
MRFSLLLYTCLLSGFGLPAGRAWAQTAAVTLQWQGHEKALPLHGLPDKIPVFSGAAVDYTERLPYFRLQLQGTHMGSFQLRDTRYEAFSPEDQRLFRKQDIGQEPTIHLNNATQNKLPQSIVTILPIRLNPQTGQLEKLISFSYTYTSHSAATQSTENTQAGLATASVLSTGNWYKIGVTNTGIHRIDKALLQSLGMNTQQLDPRTLQLFGNGGGILPQAISAPRPDDLIENAIWVAGEADGRFDDGDYVLFYAQGPHTWQYTGGTQGFQHQHNIYSDTAYYFIRVGTENGVRMHARSQAGSSGQTLTSYNERLYHERDLRNMVYSGREWYGEDFSIFNTSREVSFPVSDIVPGSDIRLSAFLMANSATESSFAIRLNNQLLGTQTISGRGTYAYHPEGVNSLKTYTLNQLVVGQPTELKATFNFNTGGNSTAIGYLNYLELHYVRQLKLYGDQTSFRAITSLATPVSTFRIAGAPPTAQVWDVTNPLRPVVQQTVVDTDISFSAPTDVLREFVVFRNTAGLKPVPFGKVANQDLHSHNLDGRLDLVVLTHPNFLNEANRLATHRRQHSNLNTIVITTRQVYNEFSSGAQDVTAIRDYMRMLYRRSAKSGGDVLYLLLLGDASYDYKNRLPGNTNFVPVYQSRQSLHPISSYSSEDYYGFLDDHEGEWTENISGDQLLDIGIGRLPVKTPMEAATVVDKIIAYDSPNHFGKWRSQVTFVADDGDNNEHLQDAEFLAKYLERNQPNYNPNKVYLDLYRQETVPNGQRSPEAVAAIDKAVEQGSLIVNYTGHGNEVSWAWEQILTTTQMNSWRNKDRLTFLLTATCEFGRYDNPNRSSGAELLLLSPQGGAIGMLTTTRPVFSSDNRILNRNFFRTAFTPVNGRMPRLGDLVQLTKNNSLTDNVSSSRGVYNRNFTLLADPSQQLAYPKLQTRITHINGHATAKDTLGALGKVSLKGIVTNLAGITESGFNGNLHVTVYEKELIRQTFGDKTPEFVVDPKSPPPPGSNPVPVKLRENIVFDGQATVKSGQFELNFVVPKDIDNRYGAGKISLYASNNTHDALGADTTIVIGGTTQGILADNTPPTIRLFMDDESFIFGGNTSQHPVLLAKLFDENGVNTSGIGSGHEIIAVLDEGTANAIVLNDYYTSERDNYQSGRIRYPFKDLPAGPHSLRLKAWDTHNNSAEEYLEFIVSNNEKLALSHILNYPNPFSTSTTFHFDHNRAGENLDIQIQIFTVSGKLVKTLHTTSYASQSHVAGLSWNGKDEFNDTLARGVYVYRIIVRSQYDGASTAKIEKLVLLN